MTGRFSAWPTIVARPGIAFIALALLSFMIIHVWPEPVSFDGGMNLQVAHNLAEGNGYLRNYSGNRYFPQEVETNAPFTLPAALTFAIFGVSIPTSQLTNILYIVAIFGLAAWIFARHFDLSWGLFAAVGILCTPGMLSWGANGYGELPALFWWLAGTAMASREKNSEVALVFAGAYLGASFVTKWVMALPVATTGFALLFMLLCDRAPIRRILQFATLVFAGFLIVAIANELWRFTSLGGAYQYIMWWKQQFYAIFAQAGVAPGFHDTPSLWAKGADHFARLAGFLSLSPVLAAAWMVVPLVVVLNAVFTRQTPLRWFSLALLVGALGYLAWWILITPTQKAWHRRVFDAMIVVQLLWVFSAAYLYRSRRIPGLVIMFSAAAFFLNGFVQNWAIATSRAADAKRTEAAITAIRDLPTNAVLFGEGWYSAPTLALYSGRRVQDITRWTPSRLGSIATGYLLLDGPAISAHSFATMLKLYAHQEIFRSRAQQVYRVDFTSMQSGLADWLGVVPTKITRPFVNGMPIFGVHHDGWASADAEFLLRATNMPTVVTISADVPSGRYSSGQPPAISVQLDGCSVGTKPTKIGHNQLFFSVPVACQAKLSVSRIQVRVTSDSIRENYFPIDNRQLSYLLMAISLS
jgi:hypothetical protein